jgi:membrane protein DedA with SNARE-associated domain
MEIALYVLALLVMPGVIMGTISSYRAGQRPHRSLYRQLQKFTHRKNKR